MTALLVALGAAVGAPLRYLADRAISARHDMLFPWGTFAVNAIGSFIAAALAAADPSHNTLALFGVGLCGGLTTFSTFAYETARLAEDGAGRHALLNVAANVLTCLFAAGIGSALIIFIT